MFSEQVVTDHRCENSTHLFIRNNVNVCTMLLICVGNQFKSIELLQIDNKSYCSYKLPLHLI